MHKIKRSSVGLVAVIVITAYATNPNYCDQKTLRHIKNNHSRKFAARTPRKIANSLLKPKQL